jgi:glutamine synthetase
MDDENVHIGSEVEMHYVDIVGRLRSVTVPYDVAFDSEVLIDASSVNMLEIFNSDLHLVPDSKTLKKLPWSSNLYRVMTYMFLDGTRFWGDSRWIAERTIEYARGSGYEVLTGAEIEFFVHKVKYVSDSLKQYVRIHNDEQAPYGSYSRKEAYQAPDISGPAYMVRKKASEYLKKMDIIVRKQHHEVAPNQAEIVTPSGTIKEVGDYIVTVKYVVKKVASDNGYVANFMPKPIAGENGSGMHIHFSLWANGSNAFWDEGRLSQTGRYFIGGILEHGRSLAALVAPTVNSYKRLISGYEAPVYLAWGIANRSVAVRVPKTNRPKSIRIEFRVPDPLANPYLALSAIALAGLDGVKRKVDPGDPMSCNAYKMKIDSSERKRKVLPRNLLEAIEELENDHKYLLPAFPRELINRYLEVKRKEAVKVMSVPSPAEFSAYLAW